MFIFPSAFCNGKQERCATLQWSLAYLVLKSSGFQLEICRRWLWPACQWWAAIATGSSPYGGSCAMLRGPIVTAREVESPVDAGVDGDSKRTHVQILKHMAFFSQFDRL